MRIQHNITALNASRNLGNNNNAVAKNLEKLSSGYKINRAGDDAAGLAISEKMRAQIRGLETAEKNSNDGISLIQTAEGALTEVHSMLNRMVELSTQSLNGTYTDDDRAKLQSEVETLKSEIDRIADSTNFNGINLLDGSLGPAATNATSTLTVAATAGTSTTSGSLTFTFTDFTDAAKAGQSLSMKVGDYEFEVTLDDAGKATKESIASAFAASLGNISSADTGLMKVDTTTAGAVKLTSTAQGAGVTDSKLAAAFQSGAANAAAITNTASTLDYDKQSLKLQVGDTTDDFNKVAVSVKNMSTKGLGIDKINVGKQDDAGSALDKIKTAINKVSSTRSDLGAVQNRLEYTINSLNVTTENITAAESRIRDVDMAKEMMAYTKNNILTQAAQSMLAQANQIPQGVLQLLQ